MDQTGDIGAMLAARGLELPEKLQMPAGMTLPFPWVRVYGDRAFVSGHLPTRADGSLPTELLGKVGGEVSIESGYEAARLTALAMLGSLQRELGNLDRVRAWLRVFGMVNAAPGFDRMPSVINGFTDLIVDLWGPEAGPHARSAVGLFELPLGAPVEIEAEVAITP